jgi:hypothetical protein
MRHELHGRNFRQAQHPQHRAWVTLRAPGSPSSARHGSGAGHRAVTRNLDLQQPDSAATQGHSHVPTRLTDGDLGESRLSRGQLRPRLTAPGGHRSTNTTSRPAESSV